MDDVDRVDGVDGRRVTIELESSTNLVDWVEAPRELTVTSEGRLGFTETIDWSAPALFFRVLQQ